MDQITEIALEYWRQGWSIVPYHVPVEGGCSCGHDCGQPGKHPRLKWAPFQHERADENTIEQWFEHDYYRSNIGVVTGQVSNLAVVDVDKGALDSFLALGLPATRRAAFSGSGAGIHFYYSVDEPLETSVLAEHVELKAEGGCITLPPSIHHSGYRYRWWRFGKMAELDLPRLPEYRSESNGQSNGRWYDELMSGVHEGSRATASARLASRYASMGLSKLECCTLMNSWNERAVNPPLSKYQLESTIRWAYGPRHESQRELVTITDIFKLLEREK